MNWNNNRNFWSVLGIAPTDDKQVIKKAYAELLTQYHPEEHPEKFAEINKAYNDALRYAEFTCEKIEIDDADDFDDLTFEQHEPSSEPAFSEPVFIEKLDEFLLGQHEPLGYSKPEFNDSIFQAGATEADIDLEEALALDVLEDLRGWLDKRTDSSYTLKQENLDMWNIIERFDPIKENPAFIRGLSTLLRDAALNNHHIKAMKKALSIKDQAPAIYYGELNDALYRLTILLDSKRTESLPVASMTLGLIAAAMVLILFSLTALMNRSSEIIDYTRAIGQNFQNRAAEQRQARPQTQNHLALSYFHGSTRPQSYEQAAYWLRRASEQGHAPAQASLGWMYAYGRGLTQSYEHAAYWYRRAAEQGNERGQNNLGRLYRDGLGVTQDYASAIYLFRKAIEHNNPNAMTHLGQMYESGRGVPRNVELAKYWYRRAAAGGNAWAGEALNRLSLSSYTQLGLRYFQGDGVTQSYERAVYLFRTAAEKGHAAAQFHLGWMYSQGRGIPQSHEQAVFWYRSAAEQGNVNGQNNLGIMYRTGRGTERNYTRAVYWFRRSAERNTANAQANLAQMYEYGRGVPQNLELAKYWYERAASGGNTWAADAVNRLSQP